ncbi:hypothetical protein PVAP13_6NG143900 [Panicum virgatum]|uniref:Uncharacterized protein n=1 Tax=Panicum virgatum TaxID=38727 RepID=A0A8T0R1W8_PANVG|nr:hypothetical protein PVAP13_6NG143900 [Panicum virgatum]
MRSTTGKWRAGAGEGRTRRALAARTRRAWGQPAPWQPARGGSAPGAQPRRRGLQGDYRPRPGREDAGPCGEAHFRQWRNRKFLAGGARRWQSPGERAQW